MCAFIDQYLFILFCKIFIFLLLIICLWFIKFIFVCLKMYLCQSSKSASEEATGTYQSEFHMTVNPDLTP